MNTNQHDKENIMSEKLPEANKKKKKKKALKKVVVKKITKKPTAPVDDELIDDPEAAAAAVASVDDDDADLGPAPAPIDEIETDLNDDDDDNVIADELPDEDEDGADEDVDAEPVETDVAEPVESSEKLGAAAPVSVAHGKVRVSSRFTSSGELLAESESEDKIDVGVFVTTPAQVSVQYRSTINLGDYNSAQVGVMVTVPCYTEELDNAYAFASAFAERKMAKEVSEITGESVSSEGAKAPAAAASDDEDDDAGFGDLSDLPEED